MSGNPRGRPPGIIEKAPRNLQHLQEKAIRVIEAHLDDDDLRAGTYVYDQNMGTAPQQATPTEMLEVVLRFLERFPEAAEHLKAQLLSEPTQEGQNAS
jgi:hypothetical protein